MNCAEAEELLGAFALDALPADEAAAFRAHIATCADHAAKAREARATAAALPALVDVTPPPPSLRARVLDAVAREPQAIARTIDAEDQRRSWGPAPRARSPQRRVMWGPAGNAGNARYAFGAMAAALVIGIGGLLAWNVVLMNRLDERDSPQRFAQVATSSAVLQTAVGAPGQGTLVYFKGDAKALLLVSGMVPAEEGSTYQMWAISGDTATSVGLMSVDESGRSSAVVPFDLEETDTFGITVEPAGGSDQPTTAPVFTARIEG